MIQKIRKVLEKIDIFGQSIGLTFRQEEYYSTSMGGLLSFCIIAAIISVFYPNIINFFAMQHITSTQEFTFADNPEKVDLDIENFMFAVQIEQANFTTNPFFNITVQQRHYYRDNNGTQTRLPNKYIDLIPCTLGHFKPIFDKYNISFEDQFQQQDLSNFLCPNLSDVHSKNMTVGGVWASTDYYFLKFSVTNCVNQTNTNQNSLSWKPICKSQEDFTATLKSQGSFRFQVYTTNFLINPNRPKQYVQPYLAIDQFYTFVPDQMFVQSDIFIKTRKISTDQGIFIYPKSENEIFPTRDYGDQREQFEVNRLTPNYYAAFYFNRSPYSYTFTRKFQRVDELLSYLGGFAQFMIVILGLIVRLYNRQHLIISLANDLYELDMSKKLGTTQTDFNNLLAKTERGREILKTIQSKKKEMLHRLQSSEAKYSRSITNKVNRSFVKLESHGTSPIQISIPVEQPKQSVSQRISTFKVVGSEYFEQFKIFMQKKTQIGFGFRFLLSKMIPLSIFQSDSCMLISKAMYFQSLNRNDVNKQLDIQNLLQQLQEMSKLKKVLFSPEQTILFNFTRKPRVALLKDQLKRRSPIVVLHGTQIADVALTKQFSDLVMAYQKIMALDVENQTEEQFRLNQRLMSLLGAELPHLLESEIVQQQEQEYVEDKEEELLCENEAAVQKPF